MAMKEFFIWLTGTDRIRVRIHTAGGEVREFVAQYETIIDGRWWPVVRYDSAHGIAHRDLLAPKGDTIGKDWYPDIGYADAVNMAIDDRQANWNRYREVFERRMK